MAASLATRCPACSTVFRVVPDQLRVSGGWVRCGRCTEVFDASESLLDMETGASRQWADANRPPADEPPARPEIEVPAAPPATAPAPAEPPGRPEAPEAPGTAEPAAPDSGTPGPPPSGEAPAVASAEEHASAAPMLTPTPDAATDPRADPADMPAFVRRADRAERWRRPGMRAALAAAALLGVLGLGAQITWAYRDLAAARYPALRPLLEQGCAWLGCRIEAARAIDALSVESSALLRVERSSVYRLSVALRNRAGIELMLPALDLVLTDTQGRLVTRKVLHAADLGAASDTLGAGAELTLQATLQAELPGTEPVAGYTIELFYP
ncbi:MAG TPA: DUF3426 domain-containing protein [Rubrivivax sp.]|nr:DUF3426 domain-containing protein [Rubrivivax sp.]